MSGGHLVPGTCGPRGQELSPSLYKKERKTSDEVSDLPEWARQVGEVQRSGSRPC